MVRVVISPFRSILKSILTPVARAALRSRMTSAEVNVLLERTWTIYPAHLATVDRSAPLGVGPAVVLRLAACMIALHAALVESGNTHVEAVRIAADVAWAVYRRMARIPWGLSRLMTRDARKRLAISTELFRRFPFGSPEYEWRSKPAPLGIVAFDCLRCPVAEYFAANRLSDLCVHTFCNLDFPLARAWGAELERHGSIAAGAPVCDLHWRSISEG